VQEVDFLAVCTCTGYVCPDVGSRLIAHMGFRTNVQRASIVWAWVCRGGSHSAPGDGFRSLKPGS
jgi:predicted naringenin-chalcone synthase